MTEIEIISEGYKELFGGSDIRITPLPRSGSDRRYFRINDNGKTIIGAFNPNPEENEAFVGFTRHFISKNLPVPEIYGYIPGKFIYYLRDLGDSNLYTWLHNRQDMTDFNQETKDLYRKIIDRLILSRPKG